jgi:hypothetical protein
VTDVEVVKTIGVVVVDAVVVVVDVVVVVVDVVVVVVPEAVYSKAAVAFALMESTAVMTYVPDTHAVVPPACVA